MSCGILPLPQFACSVAGAGQRQQPQPTVDGYLRRIGRQRRYGLGRCFLKRGRRCGRRSPVGEALRGSRQGEQEGDSESGQAKHGGVQIEGDEPGAAGKVNRGARSSVLHNERAAHFGLAARSRRRPYAPHIHATREWRRVHAERVPPRLLGAVVHHEYPATEHAADRHAHRRSFRQAAVQRGLVGYRGAREASRQSFPRFRGLFADAGFRSLCALAPSHTPRLR